MPAGLGFYSIKKTWEYQNKMTKIFANSKIRVKNAKWIMLILGHAELVSLSLYSRVERFP